MNEGFLTPWRLRVYPLVLLGALALAVGLALASGQGAGIISGRLGGDFAEFYAAGRLVLTGQGHRLYDAAAQAEAQAGFMPVGGHFVPFAYPPQMALVYAPLAALPYRAAFAVHFLVMAGLLFAAVKLACRDLPWARPHTAAIFCAAVFFYPLFRSLLGGQNTALTLALAAAALTWDWHGRKIAAGICLGLLAYKPQFAAGLLLLFFLGGRWRTAGWALGTMLATLVCNSLLFGPEWPFRWLPYANWVVATSLGLEGDKAVSCLGVCRQLLAGAPGLVVGYGLAGAVLGLAGWMCWRNRGTGLPPALRGLAATALVLAAPHAYYYDAGLVLFACLALPTSGLPHPGRLAFLLWLAGLTQLAAPALGLSPVFLALLVAYGLMLTAARRAPHPSPR